MVAHLLARLRRELDIQRDVLQRTDPSSLVWLVAARVRRRTLEMYFDLLPHVRERFGIEPTTVICVL